MNVQLLIELSTNFSVPHNLVKMTSMQVPDAPWDCHRTADQARGGAFGGSIDRQSYGSPMERLGVLSSERQHAWFRPTARVRHDVMFRRMAA